MSSPAGARTLLRRTDRVGVLEIQQPRAISRTGSAGNRAEKAITAPTTAFSPSAAPADDAGRSCSPSGNGTFIQAADFLRRDDDCACSGNARKLRSV